jgi:HAD superfamily hydrolase (TIGR01509 family)
MKLDHVGIEVQDLFEVELFYRTVLGFAPRYRYVSRNSPGLRTVFLERDGVALELLERPRGPAQGRGAAPGHLALEVEDVDGEYARLAGLGLPEGALRPPRDTGDGYREMELRDPEGNVVELSARVRPPPRYPVRGVVFDLDGTLLDSEPSYYEADRELLARRGIPFSEEEKRRYIGRGNLEMMEDLRRRHRFPESTAALVEEKNRIYLEIALRRSLVFPEMRRLVALLRQRGLPLAVASGTSPGLFEPLLAAAGLSADLPVRVSAEEVERGKPAPDVFVEAARRMGLPPHECLAIEDSQWGVEAAKRAFMRCIAVPYPPEAPLPRRFALADLLFAEGMAGFDAARALAWMEPLLAP